MELKISLALPDEALLPELAAALEKRVELASRARLPRFWPIIDWLHAHSKGTPRQIRFRRIYRGILAAVLWILSLVLLLPAFFAPQKLGSFIPLGLICALLAEAVLLYIIPKIMGAANLVLGVIIIRRFSWPCFPGHAYHGALALAAEQFSCKQIIAVGARSADRIFLCVQAPLNGKPSIPVNDGRQAAGSADIAIYVDAGIAFIGKHIVEAIPPPGLSAGGGDPSPIKVVGNICDLPAGQKAVVDFLHKRSAVWIQLQCIVLCPSIAKGDGTGNHAVLRIIGQTALDVHSHLCAAKFSITLQHGLQKDAFGTSRNVLLTE